LTSELVGDGSPSGGSGLGKLTRVPSGGNLPPSEVIMSRGCACSCEGRRVHWPVFSVSRRPASGKEVPMRTQHARPFSRRRFLRGMTLAGTVGLLGWYPRRAAAEPPPETTRLRLPRISTICAAPVYVAEELLHGEGFTDVQYVKKEGGDEINKAVASGELDLTSNFSGPFLLRLEAGDPIVTLAGLHVGCIELFGTEQVRALRDVKGKTVAVRGLGAPEHVFLASMAAYVGLAPTRTSVGSSIPRPRQGGSWPRGTLTPLWPFHPLRSNCGRSRSGTWWSAAAATGPGRSTSAASWWGTGSSSGGTPWRPNGRCAPS
jgi:hypothetical protein